MKNFSVAVIHFGEIPQNNLQQINIGMMLRTSVQMGCTEFYIIGDCGFDKKFLYGHGLVEAVKNGIIKIKNVLCSTEDEIIRYLNTLPNTKIFSTPLSYPNKTFDFDYTDEHPIFIFGAETTGISEYIIKNVYNSKIVTIPKVGSLSSYNSSISMAMICSRYLNLL